jgi:hypothetical protein
VLGRDEAKVVEVPARLLVSLSNLGRGKRGSREWIPPITGVLIPSDRRLTAMSHVICRSAPDV